MSTATPYIFVSAPMKAQIDRWPNTPQGTLTTETVTGYHAFWAARIPYIPAVPLEDGLNANNRIGWQISRQVRFLSNLLKINDSSSTFELRYIADPRDNMEARVGLVLIGKVFDPDPHRAKLLAWGRWEQVSGLFPSETPYHYPLAPVALVSDPPDVHRWEMESFAHWFEPISDDDINSGRFELVELRKYEEWPQTVIAPKDIDYIPHPFTPPIDYTGMTGLLSALARLQRPAYVGVAIRPQRLAPRERSEIARFAGHYAHIMSGDPVRLDPAESAQRRVSQNTFDANYTRRAKLGHAVYGALNEQSEALALATIRIVATPHDIIHLSQAVGSEIMANTGQITVAHPGNELEREWALFNMRWLEMERWGISPRLARFRDLQRLRFLVTAPEIVAAFRLPSALPGAHLDGLPVSDQPFTSRPTNMPQDDDVIGLGQVMSGGVSLGTDYRLPRRAFSDGISLIGDERVERGEVAGVLLSYLAERGIPTTVLGPRESDSMRALLASVGARATESTESEVASDASPPFTPPEGVPLVRWISAVARALALAYTMPTSASLALQVALTNAFVAAGGAPNAPWDQRLRAPETPEVATALRQEVAKGDLSADMRAVFTDLLLPGLTELQYAPSLKRIQTQHGGPVFLLSESIEMYRSAVARSALACASAAIALERAARDPVLSAQAAPRGALLLIDPHLLYPATLAGDQPLLPLLEGLRQAQCGVITLTTRPQLVDPQVFTGVLVAQRLTAADSIAACQRIMRLSDRETQQLNILEPGDTLWQRDGATVHVRRANVEPNRRLSAHKDQWLSES